MEQTNQTTSQGNTEGKRVVIVLPPLYLDRDLAQKIKEKTEADSTETDWDESRAVPGRKTVAILHKFPSVSKDNQLGKNTFFVIAGFDKEALKAAVKSVDAISQQHDPSQTNQMAEKVVDKADKEKAIDDQWPEYERFLESIQNNLPNNYMLVREAKIDDIMQGIDLGFIKLGVL